MTSYDELRADMETLLGLLHDLEARMAVRIDEHARMKAALEFYATLGDLESDSGQRAIETLESLKQEKP